METYGKRERFFLKHRAVSLVVSLVIVAFGVLSLGYLVYAAALSGTNVQPASTATGTANTVTISFTTTTTIPANGKVKVTFPSGYNISGASGVACPTMDGTFVSGVSGQILTITRQNNGIGQVGAAETCTVNGIINPVIAGASGTYTISTTDASDVVLDTDAAVASDNIVASFLTGTNVQPASLNTNTSNTVTVTFTTVNAIENNGKILVTFPAGFNVTNANSPACSTMDGSFAINVNSQEVSLTRSGGNPAAPGAHSCTIGNIINPASAGTTGTYTIKTTSGSAQMHDIDASVPGDTMVGPAATLSGTNVQPASLVAGTSNTATISFTTTTAVPANGKIRVTFSNSFNVSGANGGTCSSMNGTFSTSVAGQQVIITRLNDGTLEGTAAETCTVGGIMNPGVAGTTTNYQIETLDNANSIINSDTAVPGDTITAGVLTNTNVQPASLVANAVSTVTATFTTVNTLETNGKVKVTFPAGFNVAGVNGGSCSSMDGTFSFNVNGQTVTLGRTGTTPAAPGAHTCTISNVTNPAGAGVTGTYTIQTTDNGNQIHDSDAAIAGDTITSSSQPLTSTNVQPASLVAGTPATVTVTFTTATAIPSNGKVKVTFPTGFNVANISGASCSPSMDGSVTFGFLGQVVTLTRSGGTQAGTGAKSCTLQNIMNPGIAGSTGTYAIETTDAGGLVLDSDMAVTADTITAAALTGTNVQPASLVAGAASTVTATFTTVNGIENNGKVKVTFPAGFVVSGVNSVSCGPSMDGAFTFGISGQTVTINRNSGTNANAGSKTCTIGNVFNPSTSGTTGTYTISTTNNSDAVHDIDAAIAGDVITTGVLTGTNVQPASLVAGSTSTVTVSFATVNSIPTDGKIKVTFGAGFNVTGATAGACPSMDGTFTTGGSGQNITLARSGGSSQSAGIETCIIGGIINPTAAGSTGTYTIRTTTSGNLEIDADATVAADTIVPAELTGTNVAPSSTRVGVTNTVTVTFTTINTLETDGKVAVTFPSGFTVSGATSGTCSTMDGSFATSVAGQSVLISRSGGSTESAGAQSCTIAGIANPAAAGTSGTYTIATTTSADAVHDSDSAVVGDTFYASSSSSSSSSSDSASGGSAAQTYEISVSSPVALDEYAAGASTFITWATGGSGSVNNVNLYYSEDGGTFWSTIAQNISNSGSYAWTVPSGGTAEGMVKAEATDLVTVLATGLSGLFTVVAAEPAGGEAVVDVPDTETPAVPSTTEMGTIDADIVIAPQPAANVDPSVPVSITAGMVIRGSASAVYYVNRDGSLSPFLDTQTFFTYADTFESVLRVADSEITSRIQGAPVPPKAGSVLVKTPDNDSVYAIEDADGANVLRWITTEAVAVALYGSMWSDYVLDVLSTVWESLTFGEDVTSQSDIQVNTDEMRTRIELNAK